MANPVTDAEFETKVLKSDKPVLVDFWATWCGPCVAMAPVIEELSEKYKEKLDVYKLDVDENQQSAERYGVMSIPTMMVFKGGEPVDQLVGAMPKEAVEKKLNEVIG